MGVYFLFSFNILYESIIEKKAIPSILTSKQSYDMIFELTKLNHGCSMYASSQSIDKIKNSLDENQKSRFEGSIEREGITQGVIGFDPESINTLFESAKSLSYKGKVIVICNDLEKTNLQINPRVVAITPTEFLISNDEALNLKEILSIKDINLIDLILVTLFRKDVCKKVISDLEKIRD